MQADPKGVTERIYKHKERSYQGRCDQTKGESRLADFPSVSPYRIAHLCPSLESDSFAVLCGPGAVNPGRTHLPNPPLQL